MVPILSVPLSEMPRCAQYDGDDCVIIVLWESQEILRGFCTRGKIVYSSMGTLTGWGGTLCHIWAWYRLFIDIGIFCPIHIAAESWFVYFVYPLWVTWLWSLIVSIWKTTQFCWLWCKELWKKWISWERWLFAGWGRYF